jgi:hypothetical protein
MADEAVVTEVTAVADTQDVAPTGAEPGKQTEARTFSQAEVDALIAERLQRAARKADESSKKAAAEAEAKALREQGEYKTLYEKEQAKAQELEQRAKGLELAALRRDIAAEVGLPPALAARLMGDDDAALRADAQALLAAIPKPSAPNLNSAPASGAGGGRTVPSDTEIEHMAARLGVSPKFAKQVVSEGKY